MVEWLQKRIESSIERLDLNSREMLRSNLESHSNQTDSTNESELEHFCKADWSKILSERYRGFAWTKNTAAFNPKGSFYYYYEELH